MLYINIPEVNRGRELTEKEAKLFEVHVIDYDDEYHIVDDIFETDNPTLLELQATIKNVVVDVKNLKRKYRKLGEYRKAIRLFDNYMCLLYIKYGQTPNMKINKQIFKIKHRDNMVKDYVPQKPKLVTKSLRTAFKNGAIGDDETPYTSPAIAAAFECFQESARKKSAELDALEAERRAEMGDEEYEAVYGRTPVECTPINELPKKERKKAEKEMNKIFKEMAIQHNEKYSKSSKSSYDTEDTISILDAQLNLLNKGCGKKKVAKAKTKKKHRISDYMRADWREYNHISNVDEDEAFEQYKANIGMVYNSRYDSADNERLRDMYMYDKLIQLGWSNAKAKQILGINKSDAKSIDRKYKKKRDENGNRLYETDAITIDIGGGTKMSSSLDFDDDDFDMFPGDFPDEIINEAYNMGGLFV